MGKRYDITAEIMRELTEYTEEVAAGIEKAADRLSKQAVKELKETSPRSTEEHKHYAECWRIKKVKKGGSLDITIYNSTKPHLTHLLEFGWLTRDGRRIEGREHIYPVREKLARDFEKACEEIIKNS